MISIGTSSVGSESLPGLRGISSFGSSFVSPSTSSVVLGSVVATTTLAVPSTQAASSCRAEPLPLGFRFDVARLVVAS